MPLSPAAERELLHLRDIALRGYHRTDGMFDIEAQLSDTKTTGFPNHDRGRIEAGEKLHGMWLRLTVDEELKIHACEASTDYAPFNICSGGTTNFSRLVGLTIKPGFLRHAQERVGGVEGCTHLREMLQQVATVAFQTLYPVRAKRAAEARRKAGEKAHRHDGTPALLNTCFAYASDSPVVRKRWPRLYTGPEIVGAEG